MLYILGRDIRGQTNSTCLQLHIPSTCIPIFEGLCVHLSLAGSSVTFIFNYNTSVVFRLGVLVRMSQDYFSSRTYSLTIKIWNYLCDCFLFKFVLLLHIYVGYTKISFCELLNFNTFSRTFVHFIIVILTWYDFRPYSIVYLCQFLLGYFNLVVFYLGLLFTSLLKSHIKVLAYFNYCVICLTILFVW